MTTRSLNGKKRDEQKEKDTEREKEREKELPATKTGD